MRASLAGVTVEMKRKYGYRHTYGLVVKSNGRKRNSPEYEAWLGMRQRCFNSRNRAYKNYGGRGITVCPEWKDDVFAFLEYIGPRPSAKHSVDRINNDGNYAPGNVRWATRLEQGRNTRSVKRSDDDYRSISLLLHDGFKGSYVAKAFHIGQSHVSRIKHDPRYQWVPI